MSLPGQLPNLLEQNKAIVKEWKTPPTMENFRKSIYESNMATAIITCMDPRAAPERVFGTSASFGVGRNAGGRVTDDTIRSLVFLKSLTNLNTVAVIHHTDCGFMHLTDDEVIQDHTIRHPESAEEIKKIKFGTWPKDKLEESIKEDVLKLRSSEALKGLNLNILGFKLITETGEVVPVDV